MKKAIAQVSVVPVRSDKSDKAEMVTQILYGESATILEVQANWTKIKMHFDDYEGWVDTKQLKIVSDEFLEQRKVTLVAQPYEVVTTDSGTMLLSLGAEVESDKVLDGTETKREALGMVARQFENVPYLWGGRSFFGIDCSGFTQLVYKVNGVSIPRDAYQQAEQGVVLDFIEEAQLGDLAFFENEEGHIHHVGIMLEDNKIIHAHGKVRIDVLDSIGIFNQEQNKHTHKLRFIKTLL